MSEFPSYVQDTWGPLRAEASWAFDAMDVAGWPQRSIQHLYRALGDDACVRAVDIESGDFGPGDVLELAPAAGVVSEEAAIAHVGAFSGEIGTLAFELLLRAYVRRVPNAPPELAWVDEGTEVTLLPGNGAMRAEARLILEHSLFRQTSPTGLANDELYRLNAPILQRLLERFAAEFGPLVEYEGPGAVPTGF